MGSVHIPITNFGKLIIRSLFYLSILLLCRHQSLLLYWKLWWSRANVWFFSLFVLGKSRRLHAKSFFDIGSPFIHIDDKWMLLCMGTKIWLQIFYKCSIGTFQIRSLHFGIFNLQDWSFLFIFTNRIERFNFDYHIYFNENK